MSSESAWLQELCILSIPTVSCIEQNTWIQPRLKWLETVCPFNGIRGKNFKQELFRKMYQQTDQSDLKLYGPFIQTRGHKFFSRDYSELETFVEELFFISMLQSHYAPQILVLEYILESQINV